jgi:hypothetical protein
MRESLEHLQKQDTRKIKIKNLIRAKPKRTNPRQYSEANKSIKKNIPIEIEVNKDMRGKTLANVGIRGGVPVS